MLQEISIAASGTVPRRAQEMPRQDPGGSANECAPKSALSGEGSSMVSNRICGKVWPTRPADAL